MVAPHSPPTPVSEHQQKKVKTGNTRLEVTGPSSSSTSHVTAGSASIASNLLATDDANKYDLSPSFVGILTYGQPRRRSFKLCHPTDGRPTTSLELYNDFNFNFKISTEDLSPDDRPSASPYFSSVDSESETDSDQPEVASSNERTSTLLSPAALQALRMRNFGIAWSGIAPPLQSPPGMPPPSATTLFQGGSAGAIRDMLEIFQLYLEAHPKKRDIRGLKGCVIPGPDAEPVQLRQYTSEFGLTAQWRNRHLELANFLLRLFHKAVKWYAKSHLPDSSRHAKHPYPVPLSGQLKITTRIKARTTEPSLQHAKHAPPDFALRWEKGRPGEYLAVGEFEPKLSPESAVSWTLPREGPVHADTPANPCYPASTPTGPAQSLDTAETVVHGYAIASREQKLMLRVASQLLLHNCTCGLLIGDSGRTLLPYERRKAPGISGNSYALCFSERAVCSSVPDARVRDTVAYADDLNEDSNRLWQQTPAHLQFTAIPGPVFGMLEWALHVFDVAERQKCHPMSINQPILAVRSFDIDDEGGVSGDYVGDGGLEATSSLARVSSPPGSAAFSTTYTALPRVERMALDPVSFTFGTYADIHHSMQLFPETDDESVVYLLSEVQQAKTVMKVHRQPIRDRSKFPLEARCPPPVLCSQGPEIEEIQRRCRAEVRVYRRLQALQGTAVPRLVGLAAPTLQPRSHAPELLLERIGVSLHELAWWEPEVYLSWTTDINEQALAAVQACHDLGVNHGDIHANNIVAEWITSADQASTASLDDSDAQRRVPAHLTTDVVDIVAHVRKIPSILAASRLSAHSGSPSQSTASASTGGEGASRAEFPAKSGRLRVALIDWSDAMLEVTNDVKACEMDRLRHVLDDLHEQANSRLRASKKGR